MKKPPVQKFDTSKIWHEQFKPYVTFARQHVGFQSLLLKELERRTGRPWKRQQIGEWFNEGVEPRFGLGMLVLHTCKEITEEWGTNGR